MGGLESNRYACAVSRIERKLERANRQIGKLESSLASAVARRKAEHERRRAALAERHAKVRTTLETRLDRERERLDSSFATCEPRTHAGTRIGVTTAWATASEWLALFRHIKGKRLTAKNRADVEEMIVKLGEAPAVLESAQGRTLAAISSAIRYIRAARADEVGRVRRQLAELRKAKKNGTKRAAKTTPPTRAPVSTKPPAPTPPMAGDEVLVPPRVYEDLLDLVRALDVEVAEPGRIAWGRAVESARHTGNKYKLTIPANRMSQLAALDSLEELERRWATGGKKRGMPLRAIGRLLSEIRELAGVEGPVTTGAPRAPAPRAGRVPAIRWKAGRARKETGVGRRRRTKGTVPGADVEFRIELFRPAGRPLGDQEVSLSGVVDGHAIAGLQSDHRTMPEAKRAARAWLTSWWKGETARSPAHAREAPSATPVKPPVVPTPAPRPRATKPSAPVRVVASALVEPGDGEFTAAASASKIIDAVEAALRLTGKRREERRSLGLLSIEHGRLYVTSRRFGGESDGASRLDCEVVGSSGGSRASLVLSLPELLGALKPLESFELRLRVDEDAVMLRLEHDRGHMVMPYVREETFKNRFIGETLRERASVDLSHAVLAQALDSVFYAASKDEARINLHGLYIEPSDEETVLAATDGHRMALARLTTRVATAGGVLHYDDTKALLWLAKGGKQAAARWSAYTNGARLIYRWSGVRKGMPWTMTARTTSWTFPPYRQVVPDPSTATDRCTVGRVELLRALKIAGADLDAKAPKVTLRIRADGLTIESENVVQGTRNQVTVPDWSCSVTNEAERVSALNWRYLADALDKGTAREFDRVRVALFEGLAPVVLKFVRELDEAGVREVVAVVMPMRLD